MNIRNLIDLNRDNNDHNDSLIENDNVSVTSNRFMNNKKNVKLPYIIGTNEFFKNEFLGIFNEEIINIQADLNKRKIENDTVYKNDFIENEYFNNPNKDDNIPSTKNILNDKNNLFNVNEESLKSNANLSSKNNIEPNYPNEVEALKESDKSKKNSTEVIKEIEKPPVIIANTIDQLKPHIISLNQFIRNPIFESNNEEEDSLFHNKTNKIPPQESKNLFINDITKLETNIPIQDKQKEDKISLPLNIFSEMDESKNDAVNQVKSNLKLNPMSKI